METTIALKNPTFYISGIGGVSPVVGYESNSNRVARYEFSTEASGASTVGLLFKNNWPDGSGGNPRIRFFIGTDPESHSNAGGPSFTYSGELAYEESGVYVNYSGSADVLLMPSTKYYLWLFPAEQNVRYVLWNTTESGIAEIKLSGGAFSTIDPQTVTIGMQNIFSVKRYNSSFTHTIEYSIGSDTGVICEKSSSDTIKWTPEFEIARQIPNSESGPATIKITTYSGNKEIGQQSVVFLLVVHPNVVPSIALFWEDESIASTAFEVLTQSVSFLSVTPTTYGIYGSTIKSTEVFLDGEKYNGGIIEKYGDLILSAKTTDSRGRSNTASLTLHIHKYEKPQIKISASRCDEDGTPNDGGEFAAVKINAITTQVNNKNTSTINLQYGDAVEVIEADVGNVEIIKTIPAPSTNALQILAIVQDKLGFSASQQMKLSAGYATMDFLAGGKGIAFGTTATEEGFTCAMPARFTGGVSISGLADLIYPVGSIYMSVGNVSPAAFFGGTWERIQDRFLLAAGSVYAAGATGGAATHTLTLDEMPSHNHGLTTRYKSAAGDANSVMISDASTGGLYTFATGSGPIGWTGGNAAHNNMPPYLAVYIWKRTA